MRLTWLGHASWRLEIENAVILIDPWLTGNPLFPPERRAEAIQGATHILITHGHFDHVGAVRALYGALNLPVSLGEKDLQLPPELTCGVCGLWQISRCVAMSSKTMGVPALARYSGVA